MLRNSWFLTFLIYACLWKHRTSETERWTLHSYPSMRMSWLQWVSVSLLIPEMHLCDESWTIFFQCSPIKWSCLQQKRSFLYWAIKLISGALILTGRRFCHQNNHLIVSSSFYQEFARHFLPSRYFNQNNLQNCVGIVSAVDFLLMWIPRLGFFWTKWFVKHCDDTTLRCFSHVLVTWKCIVWELRTA